MGQAQGKDQLPVEVGEVYTCMIGKTIWSVHNGKRKDSAESVTVFVFSFANKSDDEIRLARSTHHRLKTLRHPNILKYIDGIELPDCIYMMTEEATPLQVYLDSVDTNTDHLIRWGLHQIMKSVGFLTIDCGLVHNNVCLSSIFVDAAGEWKLGGVEFMYPFTDTNVPIKLLHSLKCYDPPETGRPVVKKGEKWSVDMWGLGCLVWEVYNGPLPETSALKTTHKIPKSLVSHYHELINNNPKTRPSPKNLLYTLLQQGCYLDNQFVSLNLKLEEIQIMEHNQKNRFFVELDKSLQLFPDRFSQYKILPHLLNALEFGGAGSAALAPLLKIGRLLETQEYQKKIVPCLVKLFNSNDRATRLNLLQQLEHFMDHLEPSVVNNQIFPPLTSGFTDTEFIIREQTVKAMLLVAPKLNDSNLNTQLLKYFAKCQMDEKPSVRTNTTVCLGRIASYLNSKTRQKILISAFKRSMMDPFPPARIAGITGLASTKEYYTPNDISTKILPALCPMAIDKEKSVREQVFRVIKLFVSILEQHSDSMPATAMEDQHHGTTGIGSDGSGAVSGWTEWAMSSITSKLYRSRPGEEDTKKPVQPVGQTVANPTPSTSTASASTTSIPASSGTHNEAQSKGSDNNTGPSVRGNDGWENDDTWDDVNEFKPLSSESHDQPRPPLPEEEGGWGNDEDNWDDFDDPAPTPPPVTTTKTQMKLGGVKKNEPEEDFWSTMGSSQVSSNTREKTPPPPVPAGLFGGGKVEDSGWGEWDDPMEGVASQTNTNNQQQQPLSETGTSDGWGFDEGGWGSVETVQEKKPQQPSLNRKEENERKREERRLRQQAARERQQQRAKGKQTSGLGAVKKD